MATECRPARRFSALRLQIGTTVRYEILSIAGEDRVSFLQGQLTQDVTQLGTAGTRSAAWCSPKGRVTVSVRVFERGDRFLMAIPAGAAEPTLKRLALYRLRARVTLDREPAWTALAFVNDDQRDDSSAETAVAIGGAVKIHYGSDLVEVFGQPEDIAMAGFDADDALSSGDWAKQRIAVGRVDIGPENAEQHTPHMLNLDRTGALSFSKGCYTGQEIVARTEHLGTVKRRVARYRYASGEARADDTLSLDGKDVGQIVNAAGSDVLAVVPVDLHRKTLNAAGVNAIPKGLPYRVA